MGSQFIVRNNVIFEGGDPNDPAALESMAQKLYGVSYASLPATSTPSTPTTPPGDAFPGYTPYGPGGIELSKVSEDGKRLEIYKLVDGVPDYDRYIPISSGSSGSGGTVGPPGTAKAPGLYTKEQLLAIPGSKDNGLFITANGYEYYPNPYGGYDMGSRTPTTKVEAQKLSPSQVMALYKQGKDPAKYSNPNQASTPVPGAAPSGAPAPLESWETGMPLPGAASTTLGNFGGSTLPIQGNLGEPGTPESNPMLGQDLAHIDNQGRTSYVGTWAPAGGGSTLLQPQGLAAPTLATMTGAEISNAVAPTMSAMGIKTAYTFDPQKRVAAEGYAYDLVSQYGVAGALAIIKADAGAGNLLAQDILNLMTPSVSVPGDPMYQAHGGTNIVGAPMLGNPANGFKSSGPVAMVDMQTGQVKAITGEAGPERIDVTPIAMEEGGTAFAGQDLGQEYWNGWGGQGLMGETDYWRDWPGHTYSGAPAAPRTSSPQQLLGKDPWYNGILLGNKNPPNWVQPKQPFIGILPGEGGPSTENPGGYDFEQPPQYDYDVIQGQGLNAPSSWTGDSMQYWEQYRNSGKPDWLIRQALSGMAPGDRYAFGNSSTESQIKYVLNQLASMGIKPRADLVSYLTQKNAGRDTRSLEQRARDGLQYPMPGGDEGGRDGRTRMMATGGSAIAGAPMMPLMPPPMYPPSFYNKGEATLNEAMLPDVRRTLELSLKGVPSYVRSEITQGERRKGLL